MGDVRSNEVVEEDGEEEESDDQTREDGNSSHLKFGPFRLQLTH